MFATAALVDAKYKDDRRKQWDHAIAEAKAANNLVRSEDSTSESEHAALKVELGDSEPRNMTQNKVFPVFGPYDQAIRLRSPVTAPWDNINSKSLQKSYETPLEVQLKILDSHMRELRTGIEPLNVKREEFVHQVAGSSGEIIPLEPQTWVHLQRMEQMVSRLVARLLLSPKSSFITRNATETARLRQNFKLEFKIMADRVAALSTSRTRLPRYAPLYPRTMKEREALNRSIETILTNQNLNRGNFDTMTAKICHRLLTSTAPPNISTYNIMLTHFTRLKQHYLAQAVIDSFLEDSILRPNGLTVAAMLDHYAGITNRSGFNSIIRHMRGENGSMHIGRRFLSGHHSNGQLESWAKDRKLIYRDGFLYAKMPRTWPVFKSLILGSLCLFGIQRAFMYFKAAVREGHRISADVFLHIAQVCVGYRDRRFAADLLSAAISHWRQHNGATELECHYGVRRVIFLLMDLCGIQQSMSASDYRRLKRGPWRSDLQTFKEWLRDVHLQDIKSGRRDKHLEAKIRVSEETILGLDIMLARHSSGESTIEQMVLGMLDIIDRHQVQWPRRDFRPLLVTIEIALDESRASIMDMQRQFISIVYEGLTTSSQKMYDELTGCSPQLLRECLQIILNIRLATPKIVEENVTLVEKDHQLPSSASQFKVKVGDILSKPFNFEVDDRPLSPPVEAGKWLVSPTPHKLEAFPFQ